MSLIDTAAIRREVDAKDATRTPPVRQWDKLPIGTILISKPGQVVQTTCEFFRPTPAEGGGRPYYAVTDLTTGERGQLKWINNEDNDDWRLSPENFADAYRRDTLAKIGFFSIDDPAHRQRHRDGRFEEAKRFAAAAALGIDRDVLLDKVAVALAPRTPEGVWPKSTAEFYKRREALDNAILYAAGVTDHA